MSMALALRDSFRERLAIYQMLNATPYRGTYDDTIRLHRRFATALKGLTQKLKSYASAERQPTSFQCRFVEVTTRRCLMHLHLPYLGPGLKDPAYSFSRKQVVDSAVKTYSLLYPASANTPLPIVRDGEEDEGPEFLSTEGDDLGRFCVCAAGSWRLLGSQPSMIVSLELQALLQEDESVGPPTVRPDLLGIVRHALAFYLSRIQAGETNVKGYLFTTALAAHVQAMTEGLSGFKSLEPILSAAIRTERTCFEVLRRQLGSSADCADAGGAGEEQFNWGTLVATDEEWVDVTGLGSFFSVTNVESFLGTNAGLDFMAPYMPF